MRFFQHHDEPTLYNEGGPTYEFYDAAARDAERILKANGYVKVQVVKFVMGDEVVKEFKA